MESETTSVPLAIPPALLADLQAEAQEAHRSTADVLQDAVKRYVREMRWQRIRAYGEARARELGLTEDDIPRLIAESRAEQRPGRE